MLQDYEIPSRRNFLSFIKSFTDFNRWFPEYQRQDVNVNQVSWITLKKNITKRNVYLQICNRAVVPNCDNSFINKMLHSLLHGHQYGRREPTETSVFGFSY